jgi:hypothetical protein
MALDKGDYDHKAPKAMAAASLYEVKGIFIDVKIFPSLKAAGEDARRETRYTIVFSRDENAPSGVFWFNRSADDVSAILSTLDLAKKQKLPVFYFDDDTVGPMGIPYS